MNLYVTLPDTFHKCLFGQYPIDKIFEIFESNMTNIARKKNS